MMSSGSRSGLRWSNGPRPPHRQSRGWPFRTRAPSGRSRPATRPEGRRRVTRTRAADRAARDDAGQDRAQDRRAKSRLRRPPTPRASPRTLRPKTSHWWRTEYVCWYRCWTTLADTIRAVLVVDSKVQYGGFKVESKKYFKALGVAVATSALAVLGVWTVAQDQEATSKNASNMYVGQTTTETTPASALQVSSARPTLKAQRPSGF